MANLEFFVPANLNDLQEYQVGQFYVESVFEPGEFSTALKSARQEFREEGCSFILTNFNIYYSILYHAKSVPRSTLFSAFQDIFAAMRALPQSIQFVFDNNEGALDEEIRNKYRNILKMLIFVYAKLVHVLECEVSEDQESALTKKQFKKKSNLREMDHCDWTDVLGCLITILQLELNKFWDPPVVDELFINLTFEIVYGLLETPNLKSHKDSLCEIWDLVGVIINCYGATRSFCDRLVRITKASELASTTLAQGIITLITKYKCSSLLKEIISELLEWQTFDRNPNPNSQRNCQKVIVDLATAMPEEIFNEMEYLARYLSCNCVNLRMTILSVITEILLYCRKNKEVKEEVLHSKVEFLETIQKFTRDKSPFVRSKVFHLMSTLQRENAIPIMKQNEFLKLAVSHLRDVNATARKSASNCVTTFLMCNVFAAQIKLETLKEQYQAKECELEQLKVSISGLDIDEMKELDRKWQIHAKPLKDCVSEWLQNPQYEEEDTENAPPAEEREQEENLDSNLILLRQSMDQKKYNKVFKLAKKICMQRPRFQAMILEAKDEALLDAYGLCIRILYGDLTKAPLTGAFDENGLRQLFAKENELEYLSNTVKFAELMDQALGEHRNLLRSTTLSDMQRACEFILEAIQFGLDQSQNCVVDLLDLMKINEVERKKKVMETLRTINFEVDSSLGSQERDILIVERLIHLLKMVPNDNYDDYKHVVSGWAEASILNNNVTDLLWKIFIQGSLESGSKTIKEPKAALILLTMAARERPLIVEKNYRIVATICLKQRGYDDVLLAAEGCKMLQLLATETDLNKKSAGFRLSKKDTIWTDLDALVGHHFESPNMLVNSLLIAAIALVYDLHDSPIAFLNAFIFDRLKVIDFNKISALMLIRFNVIVGELAIRHLHFLDHSVYKELKRRKLIQQEKKAANKVRKPTVDAANSESRDSARAKRQSMRKNMELSPQEDSIMEGAEAFDEDSDYLSTLLDNYLCLERDPNALCKMYEVVVKQCKNFNQYKKMPEVQTSAVTALLRGMLLSGNFCQRHINLVFTILARSDSLEVRKIIVLHISDLLELSPNIIEPYTSRIYELLYDNDFEMRKITFNILAMLILKDMIRPQEKISDLARCLMDPSPEMHAMVKNFFQSLAQKSNNLYNHLPDIFSHLIETVDEEPFRDIMKYLFSLIDKVKHVENLTERFCLKFKTTDQERVAINLAHVLTMMSHTDKSIKKLVQNFACVQHFVPVPDVYASLKSIISKYRKNKGNALEASGELDSLINNVFQGSDNRNSETAAVTSTAKKSKKKAAVATSSGAGKARKKRGNDRKNSFIGDNDEDDDEESEMENVPLKRTSKKSRIAKSKTNKRNKVVTSSSSDE